MMLRLIAALMALTTLTAIQIPSSAAPMGAIEGRLTDDSGAPLRDITVRAQRRIKVGSYVTLVMGGGARTNDLGEFRVFDLPAGEYLVLANQTQRATAFTWYPGRAGMEGARIVRVHAGQDTKGIDFTPLHNPMATVTVKVTDSRGMRITEDCGVTLQPRASFHGDGDIQARPTQDGSFVAQDVPEGDYVLGAQHCGAKQQVGAYAEVTVRSGSTAFALQTNTGAIISGRLIVNGQPAGSPGTERLTAHVFATSRIFGYQYFDRPVVKQENTWSLHHQRIARARPTGWRCGRRCTTVDQAGRSESRRRAARTVRD